MSRLTREELRALLGAPSTSPPPDVGAPASPEVTSPATDTSALPDGAAATRSDTTDCAAGKTSGAFTPVHAELGKVLPTLWARACVDATRGGRPRERLLVLLRWWAGKHGHALHERVAIASGDTRRLDLVLQAGSVRLALELDARFSAASLEKLRAAQRAGYAVMVVWTTSVSSREQARALRRRVSDTLNVRNLHWLPMFHANWGWV